VANCTCSSHMFTTGPSWILRAQVTCQWSVNLVVLLYTVEVCVIVLAMDHCPLSSIHVIK